MNKRPDMGKKAYIGMSGGVDSSVSAALLKKAGYDVTGVFIRAWQPDWIDCTWREERLDAMRAAAALDIPFVTLDLEKEYKKGVVDYMIAEYKAGRTPNPDVMCNREIKFGAFYDWAMERGADFVATGHYAQITPSTKQGSGASGQSLQAPSLRLLKGADFNKDQSYFLWTIRQEQLPHVLFPVGGIAKPEVRRLALKFKLPNAEKKDSQGLCFIGKIDIKEFLSHYVEAAEGNVLDAQGRAIGRHPGALFFTIGERHGFDIDHAHKTPNDDPYYVIGKDVEKNTITVSTHKAGKASKTDSSASPAQKISISNANWISGAPQIGKVLEGRIRYRAALYPAKVARISEGKGEGRAGSIDPHTAELEFADLPEPIAPGQSLVLYDGEECVGGGVIM